jgi:hypothetical protein
MARWIERYTNSTSEYLPDAIEHLITAKPCAINLGKWIELHWRKQRRRAGYQF